MADVVTIERREYDTLLARIQELEDIVHMRQAETAVAAGASEWLPAAVVDRLCAGESPMLVWREYRGLSRSELAGSAGLSPERIVELETGRNKPSLDETVEVARALSIDLEDLVAPRD